MLTQIDLTQTNKERLEFKKTSSVGDVNSQYFNAKEQKEIFSLYKETGNIKYRDLLINSVIQQAISIATKMAKYKGVKNPEQIETAKGEALYELVRTFDSYDPEQGTYSTYIRNVVKNKMLIFFKQYYGVKVPLNVVNDIETKRRGILNFIKKNQREPFKGEQSEYKGLKFNYTGDPSIMVYSPEVPVKTGNEDSYMSYFDLYESNVWKKTPDTLISVDVDGLTLDTILNQKKEHDFCEKNEKATLLSFFLNELPLRDRECLETTYLRDIDKKKAIHFLTPITSTEWKKFKRSGMNEFKIECLNAQNEVIESINFNLFSTVLDFNLNSIITDNSKLNSNTFEQINIRNFYSKVNNDLFCIRGTVKDEIKKVLIYNKKNNKLVKEFDTTSNKKISYYLNLQLAAFCSYATMGQLVKNAILKMKSKFIKNYV